jgi:DNA repair protein RadC
VALAARKYKMSVADAVVGEGDIASVGVSVREIAEVIIKRNATGIVLSHNHPGASALPSIEDITTTERLYKILADMQVTLIDHIILTDGDYVSFIQSARLRPIFKYLYRD